MNFRRWVVFSFLAHVLVVVLDKGAGLVLTLLLGDSPQDKGVADLLTTLPFILMAVANLGLATSLVYFVRRHGEDVQKVADTTSLVAMVWGGLVAGLAIVLTLTMVPALRPDWTVSAHLVVPVCLCVPFLLLSSYWNSIQLATERVRDYNVVHVVQSAAFLPLFLLFYLLGGGDGPAAPGGVAYGRLAVAVLMTAVVMWMLRGVVRFRPRLHGSFLRRGLSFGWKANITSVMTYLNHRVDLLLLPFLFLATSDVQLKSEIAFYSLAVTFAELIWHFPEALRDLFFSKVSGETHERARTLTPVLSRLCLAVAVLGTFGVALAIGPILAAMGWIRGTPGIYAESWLPTVWPAFLWLAPGTAAYTVAKILQNDLAARGHLHACIAACFVTFVVMIGLDVLLVPDGGAVGAAQASSVAYLSSAAFTLWIYPRLGGASRLACLLPRRQDMAYVRDIAAGIRAKLRRRRTQTAG